MTQVFVWCTGQDENIGDSLLRRPYLNALRQVGPIHVFLGDASDRFVSGLDLQTGDTTYSDFNYWSKQARTASGQGERVIIAANAGEVPVSRRGALRFAQLVKLVRAVRKRQGDAVWIGAGVPRGRAGLAFTYRAFARNAAIVGFRDAASASLMISSSVVPDWAFSLGSPTQHEQITNRGTLAIVLRGDRPAPNAGWVAWVRDLAENHRLRVRVVVQVLRDNDRASSLAEALGGVAVPFPPDMQHDKQEELVREIYRESKIVLGDRLHGLIVGATEGAVPLGWVPSSSGKIGRHFDAIGLEFVGAFEGKAPQAFPELSPTELIDKGREVNLALQNARVRIDSMSDRLFALAGGESEFMRNGLRG